MATECKRTNRPALRVIDCRTMQSRLVRRRTDETANATKQLTELAQRGELSGLVYLVRVVGEESFRFGVTGIYENAEKALSDLTRAQHRAILYLEEEQED